MGKPLHQYVTVSFYVVEPHIEHPGAWTGDYPADDMLDAVEKLDLASGLYHVQTNLFGNEVFCMVEDGQQRMLSCFTKDSWNALQTEFKGQVEEVPLRDGEGWVEATYCTFFPQSVAAVVRTSTKSPGAAQIGRWVSMFTPQQCYLATLPKIDALAELQRPSKEISSVRLRAKTSLIQRLRPVRPDLAGILEAAAGTAGSSNVDITLGVPAARKAHWWAEMYAIISDLADAQLLADFDSAMVNLVGKTSPINLKEAFVKLKVPVDLQVKLKIGPSHAAIAMVEAYGQLKDDVITPAVEAWKGKGT